MSITNSVKTKVPGSKGGAQLRLASTLGRAENERDGTKKVEEIDREQAKQFLYDHTVTVMSQRNASCCCLLP